MNEKLIQKIEGAKSPEEILEIAKKLGKDVTLEQATELFNAVNSELDDNTLENVTGGTVLYHQNRQWYNAWLGETVHICDGQ